MGFGTDKSSGLLGHFVGVIDNSFAGTKANIQDGRVTLGFWEVLVEDVRQDDFDNVPPPSVNMNIGLGKDWQTDDKGLLYHEDDAVRESKGMKPREFKSTSLYGQILDLVTGEEDHYKGYGGGVVVLDGGEEVEYDFSGVLDYFEAMGYDDPRDFSIWEGLRFEFRGLGLKIRGSKEDPGMKAVPVKFLGGPATENVTTKKAEAPARVEWDFSQYEVEESTAETLNDLLNSSRTHTAFVKAAMKVDGVSDNAELLTALTADDGPWSVK